jgi:penicillin-binding protein 1A
MRTLYPILPQVSFAGKKLVGRVVFALLIMASAAIGAVAGMFLVYSTDLPQIAELEHYRPNAITEIYDDQGNVIGSFALQRRIIANYEDFPPVLRDAVTSIEDKDFDHHWGVDFGRIAGAAWRDVSTHSRSQGASTLTMQLSRNLFLSSDRNFSRKFQEMMLAIQIERHFTKEQIFTLYANQIYLGHGVYGFAAGSQYYFGKSAKDLTVAEAAVLASLPKSANQYSPINYPQKALQRRNLVLNAMLEDGKITAEQATAAKASPITLHLQSQTNAIAPYFVEEIRRYLEKKYGSEDVHQNGLRVYTTLNLAWQKAATHAALDGLAVYERRHGWKGKLKNILESEPLESYEHPDWADPLAPGDYVHALVTEASSSAHIKFGQYTATLAPADIAWTGKHLASDILHAGDVAYVKIVSLPTTAGEPAKVTLEEDSGAQVALMAVDNATGDIKAMVGGRDFHESQFNRATQALRQVGSSFKPYVYTAAIDTDTLSLSDYILDSRTTFMTAGGPYTPGNYDGKFWGNLPLKVAFANSRNIPALKVAEKVGIKTVIEYAHKFGVTSNILPFLPVALGSAEITLFEQTAAYSTFPNDGVRVLPRYIRKVTDYDGHVREENYPEVRDVIGAKTARTMVTLLQAVVQQGTSTAALKLKHPVGGKTGTTNDFTDAWFVGFSPSVTCGVWVGFDEKKSLGPKETGGQAALPIWIDFMKVAIQGRDTETFAKPEDLPNETDIRSMVLLANLPHGGDAEAGEPAVPVTRARPQSRTR